MEENEKFMEFTTAMWSNGKEGCFRWGRMLGFIDYEMGKFLVGVAIPSDSLFSNFTI